MTNLHRVVDLSGFMFSGKSAVSDVLREFERFDVPHYRSEFDLLRISGGLIDLKNAVMDWSPIRTPAALERFERVANRLAATPGFPDKLFATGFGYSKRYPNFEAATREFIDAIVEVEWQTPWPYDDLNDSAIATLRRKILRRLGSVPYRRYRLISRQKFMAAVQAYVGCLLWQATDRARVDTLVTHNALEPFNPQANLDLLGPGAKSIVVDRDPRDIYATAITTQTGFNDDLEFYKRIAGAHDVDVFIARYRIYRESCAGQQPDVLRLRFEDLVSRYNETVGEIRSFLEVPAVQHAARGTIFKPEVARQNVGLWTSRALRPFEHDFVKIANACCG
jgi:hypothetical protein